MSFITKNYKVEFIVNNTTFTDITDFVVSLDDFVLQSTGKLNTAKLTLNAEFGNFITEDNGGDTPIIEQFQLLRIRVIGDDGITEQLKVFEVVTDLAQLAGRSSNFLPLELEGRERNLYGIPFGGFFRSATHKEIIQQIQEAYNQQHKTLQPGLLQTGSPVPDFNPNIWDFTQVDNCYDAIVTVLDSLNLPVSAGGAGNRFGLIFEDRYISFPDNLSSEFILFKILVQGTSNINGPNPILEQNDENPITKIDKIKQASTGTVIVARGRPKTAQQPQNYSLFIARVEFYRGQNPWFNDRDYPEGVFVVHDQNVGGWAQHWQANSNTTAGDEPGVSANWSTIDVGDFVGDLQYSPFTVDKKGPIKNGFANPEGDFQTLGTNAIAIPDHNLVINDVRGVYPNRIGTFRDWVLFRTNSPQTADITALGYDKYMFDFGSGGLLTFYNGFKVLVDENVGALVAPFDGVDSNGFTFANNIAEFRTPPGALAVDFDSILNQGEWFVTRERQDFDQTAVYAEAKVYEWNVSFDLTQVGYRYPGDDRQRGGIGPTFEWRDISGVFMGNECFHNPISVESVDGLVASNLTSGEPLNDPSNDPYNELSAIEIVFGYNQADETQDEKNVWYKFYKRIISGGADGTDFVVKLATAVFNTFTTPQYTNLGWWFAWPSPYPFSRFNSIIENVGGLYGGDFSTLNDHRFYDLFNIQHTTTGKSGWTHDDSQDLSEITGVEFLFNYDITVGGVREPITGDIPFSYWCLDRFGTMWKSQKIMLRHLGETQQIRIEFGDLSPVIRNRTPLGVDNILENIIVGEIEVNEVFFKENIIIQGFQCETPYDEFGRYSPSLWEQIIKPVFFDVFGQTGGLDVRFKGIIDAYGFTKTPVAISASNSLSDERTIIPTFADYQNIVNVEQLQRFADSFRDIEQFQYEQYTVEQGGINDLNLEDSVALHDEFLIKEDDQGLNTRNIAVRELHYSVPFDGGLIRKLVGVKVIDT